MIPMTLAEVASIVNGELSDSSLADRMVTGNVEFDSRKVGPGDLFLALEGSRVDGHEFAEDVAASGAVATIATKDVPTAAVYVGDAIAALTKLASVVARRSEAVIIGVTGSNGKTSTKDLMAALCESHGPTVSTRENFNNELGHPYTVCQVQPETRYLVLEVSARGLGHITHLTDIAPPDIGVVLNVGISHLDGFGSIETTAKAKGELPESLGSDGTAVLNADDERVAAMRARTSATVLTYGYRQPAAVSATALESRDGRYAFTLTTPSGQAHVALQLWGEHHVSNALAAAGVAHTLGIPVSQTADVLSSAGRRSQRRMDVFTNADNVTVIDDSYNANPASMAGALRSLAAIPTSGRRIAALGLMADLEELSHSEHSSVGTLAAQLGIDEVIAVGEGTEPIVAAIRDVATSTHGTHTGDQTTAIELIRDRVRPGDTVLVKGSRYRTWDIADHLRGAQEDQIQ